MITLVPNSFGSPVKEFNPHHEPAGSAKGGQFAKASGAPPLGGTLPPSLAKHAKALAEARARMHAISYNPANRTKSVYVPSDEEIEADPVLKEKVQAWLAEHEGQTLSLDDMPDWAFKKMDKGDIETMVFLDSETGKLLPTPIGDVLEGMESSVFSLPGTPFGPTTVPIHAHPNSSPPSGQDFYFGVTHGVPAIMVFGQDGSWYHAELRKEDAPRWQYAIDGELPLLMYRSQQRLWDEAQKLTRQYGITTDDRAAYQQMGDLLFRDSYAKDLQTAIDNAGLSHRYTAYLAPRDLVALADRVAARHGFHRR